MATAGKSCAMRFDFHATCGKIHECGKAWADLGTSPVGDPELVKADFSLQNTRHFNPNPL
jgi:hypothetical protein